MIPTNMKKIFKSFKKLERRFMRGDHLKYPPGHILKVMLETIGKA